MTTDWIVPEIASTERFTFMHGYRSIKPGLFDRLTGCRIYIAQWETLRRSGLDEIAELMNDADRELQAAGCARWDYDLAVSAACSAARHKAGVA